MEWRAAKIEACDADRAFLVLRDADVFRRLLTGRLVDGRVRVKQVTNVVAVQLQKLDLDRELAKLGLLAPVLDFVENEVENARQYAYLIVRQADRAARSHRVRFARACLAIRQYGSIVAAEAA